MHLVLLVSLWISVTVFLDAPAKRRMTVLANVNRQQTPGKQLEALQAVRDLDKREGVLLLTGLLGSDIDRRVKGKVAEMLGESGDVSAVPALIGALEEAEPILQGWHTNREVKHINECFLALEKLTGQHLGTDTGTWTSWWKKELQKTAKKAR